MVAVASVLQTVPSLALLAFMVLNHRVDGAGQGPAGVAASFLDRSR